MEFTSWLSKYTVLALRTRDLLAEESRLMEGLELLESIGGRRQCRAIGLCAFSKYRKVECSECERIGDCLTIVAEAIRKEVIFLDIKVSLDNLNKSTGG